MKKQLLIILAVLALCGCSVKKQTTQDEVYALVKDVTSQTIKLDIVEYITSDNSARIEELELDSLDMPNGYYINNPEIDFVEYSFNDDTVYNFIDWQNDFVAEGEDRHFTTTKNEDFKKYIETYNNGEPKMPFIIKMSDNKIISISEILIP